MSEGAGLSVAAVARRLGLAPATLRTWDRRYGLGASGHAAGAHRRYTTGDLDRLERMRGLLLEGHTTADAARQVLAEGPVPPATVAPASDPAPAVLVAVPPADPADEEPEEPARGGGRALALPGAGLAARGLARAVMSLDADGARAVVRASLDERGVLPTWDDTIRPVLVAAGTYWASTGDGVEVEHLLADVVHSELRRRAHAGEPSADGQPPVLLACVDGDFHSLPLHALAAALAERGVASRTLGGSVPAVALRAAVSRTGPAAVFLYAQLPVEDPAGFLAAVPATRPPVTVVVGGPGWQAVPRRALHAHGLGEAVDGVLAGLGRRSA